MDHYNRNIIIIITLKLYIIYIYIYIYPAPPMEWVTGLSVLFFYYHLRPQKNLIILAHYISPITSFSG